MTLAHTRRTGRTVLIMLFISLFTFAPPGYALFGGKVEHFSADSVDIAPDGTVLNTSKMYVSPGAVRIDGMPGGGMPGSPKLNISMLILEKQNISYFYNHDKKLVYEGPVDEEDLSAGYKALDNVESEKVLGKETVSGYPCVKKEVVTSFTVAGQTMTDRLIVWESDKFGFPLKTLDDEGGIHELRNIQEKKPSKKLFQPLSGYKKVGSMMAVMGMDFGAVMTSGSADPEPAEDGSETESPRMSDPDMQNMDMDQMMAAMKQAMGDSVTPEEMAEMQQAMAQAMQQAGRTRTGQGAADDLWKIVPRRAGDKIGYEMKTTGMINVVLGTRSTLQQVFDFYGNKLKAGGWMDGGTIIQNGQGMMSLMKNEEMIQFAWADRPDGMQENFPLYYNIRYSGPVQ